MKCPMDGETLLLSERQGIEIDYCPKCRGIWLDRGELDKIIERSTDSDQAVAAEAVRTDRRDSHRKEYRDDVRTERHHSSDYDSRYHKKSRKKSFLSDLFDFGD